MKFSEFKKAIGETGPAISEATGYTREGLYKAFKKPTEAFKHVIYELVISKIDEENRRHEERMQTLRRLQDEMKPYQVKARELDQKVSVLSDRRKAL